MAEKNYDGEITLGVGLDISKTKSPLHKLIDNIKKAFENKNPAIRKMGLEMQKLADKIDATQRRMKELENTKLPTEEFTRLNSQIEATTAKMEALKNEMKEMSDSGTDMAKTRAYSALQEQYSEQAKEKAELEARRNSLKESLDSGRLSPHMAEQAAEYIARIDTKIEKVNQALNTTEAEMKQLREEGKAYEYTQEFLKKKQEAQELEQTLQSLQKEQQFLEQTGGAYTSGADTQEYADLKTNLGYMEQQASIMNQKFDEATGKGKRLATIITKIKEGAGKAFRAVGAFLKNSVAKGAERASKSIGSVIKKVIAYGLGISSLITLFNKLKTYTTQAFQDMAKQFPEVNAPLSELVSNFSQLKASIGTAFQPLLSVVLPVLNTIIDALTTAANAAGAFFAALTGQGFIYKATKQQKNFAGAVGGTGSAAKEAKQELAEYDKLIVISSNDAGGGSGGGGGAGNGAATFEKTPIEGFLGDFGKTLAEMIKNGDWYGVGNTISTKLTEVMQNIPWDSIFEKARGFGKGLADFLNGLITPDMFGQIGRTLANGLNTAFEFLYTFVTNFDWTNLGKSIASAINNFFATFDFHKAGATVGKLVIGLVNAIATAVGETDWTKVGKAIVNFITAIDWVGVFGAVAVELPTAIIGAIIELILGAGEGLTQDLADAFKDLGEDGIAGFFQGISDNIAESGEWIHTQFNKILQAIKDFFGIHSPSTVMADVGEDFMQGFWNGLKEKLDALIQKVGGWLDTLKEKFEKAKEKIKETWDKVKTKLGETWDSIKTKYNNVQTWFSQKFTGAYNAVKNAWSGAKSFFSNKATEIKNAFSDIKTKISEKFEGAWNGIKTAFGDAKTWFEGKAKDIKGAFDDIKEDITDKFSKAYEGAKSAFSKVKEDFAAIGDSVKKGLAQGTSGTSIQKSVEINYGEVAKTMEKMFEGTPGAFQGIGDSIKTGFGNAIGEVKAQLESLVNFIQGGEFKGKLEQGFKVSFDDLGNNLKNTFTGIIDRMVDAFNTAISNIGSAVNQRLQKIRETSVNGKRPFGSIYDIDVAQYKIKNYPHAAKGAVIPPNHEFLAVLGDQKHGTNLETPLNTMIDAFKTALDEGGYNNKSSNMPPIVLQLNGRKVAEVVWDEETKRYKQTGSWNPRLT